MTDNLDQRRWSGEPPGSFLRRSDMHKSDMHKSDMHKSDMHKSDMHKSDTQKCENKGRQVAFTRQDLLMLRMPPTCAVTGEHADTAIVVHVGDVDLILPVCDRIRSEHLRRFGPLRTAWQLRPSVHDDVVRLGNASSAFVEQLLTINEPGRVYAGGLYPLKPSHSADHDIDEVAEKVA